MENVNNQQFQKSSIILDEVKYQHKSTYNLKLETERIEHRGRKWVQHRLTSNEGSEGVLLVVTRGDSILVVDHFRPVVRETLIEFPRGFGKSFANSLDSDDEAILNAKAELFEETGYNSESIKVIGRIFPDSGILGNRVSVVHVEVIGDPVGVPDNEVDSSYWVNTDDFIKMIAAGRIMDGLTLSAFSIYQISRDF